MRIFIPFLVLYGSTYVAAMKFFIEYEDFMERLALLPLKRERDAEAQTRN